MFSTFAHNQNSERTYFCTFAAANTFLLVDYVNALCILSDCSLFAGFRTLTALYTNVGLYSSFFLADANGLL